MKIAIYSRGLEYTAMADVVQLLDLLYEHNVQPVIYQDLFNQIYTVVKFKGEYSTFHANDILGREIECIISLGGDGTILDTVTFVRDSGIPVLGINYGRLGFLASVGKEEMTAAIEAILHRKYALDQRTMVRVEANVPLFGRTPFGLNELGIHKTDISPMIKIHTYLNGEFLNTFWCDGIIVATPTGSTGYSLSCNGPVVFPDSGSFVITAVAPHNLNIRPIVIPDDNIVTFEMEGRTDGYIVSLDGRRELVSMDVHLAVRRESFNFNLVRLNDNNFLQTLRNKLSWGLDKRN